MFEVDISDSSRLLGFGSSYEVTSFEYAPSVTSGRVGRLSDGVLK